MMKHTPGPWVWYDKHEKALLSGGDKDKNQCYPVVMIVDVDGHRSPQEADKHLIAAAPDLLEALEAMVEWYGIRYPNKFDTLKPPEKQTPETQKAMNAIAKASGSR